MSADKIEFTTESEAQTRALGAKLAPRLRPGDLLSLTGDLGAGKTRFTQGIAAALGITELVTSPTFTIIKEYPGPLPLYHFDVYRIKSTSEMDPLGYEEYFYGDGATVVEWGDKIEPLLPPDHLTIEIHRSSTSPSGRRFLVCASGPRSKLLLLALETS